MARIYEYPDPQHIAGAAADLPPPTLTPRAVTRSLGTFLAAGAVVGTALFAWSYYRSGDSSRALFAAVIGIAAVGAILLIRAGLQRSPRGEHGKLATASPDRRVELVMEQLDDRFAVFRGVKADGTSVDHLIVGPTGVFAVVDSGELIDREHVDPEADAQAMRECEAIRALLERLTPELRPKVQPVVCIAPGADERVHKDELGVWLVPADKLAVALIKRSNQQGAITENVNETGAFSSSTLQSAAIERALADHWSIPTRRTIADYIPKPGT